MTGLRLVRYGAGAGPVAIYFHGAPGAPEEVARFDTAAREAGVRLLALDRGALGGGEAVRFERLAAEVETLSDGAPAHLIGYSLGAFAAARTAALAHGRIASLDLISAAAPLELGDFLDGMAGKPVFTLARSSPGLLGAMTALQSAVAAVAPMRLFDMLFATAVGEDRALAQDAGFRAELGAVLRRALGKGRPGYLADVRAYVRPWSQHLAEVTVESHIWHGLEDNWAPPAMAVALERALPSVAQTDITEGLSHYSCLYRAMPRILARIGGGEA